MSEERKAKTNVSMTSFHLPTIIFSNTIFIKQNAFLDSRQLVVNRLDHMVWRIVNKEECPVAQTTIAITLEL